MIFPRLAVVLFLGFAWSASAQDAAFVPSNPPEMKRLTNPDSPAHRTAAHFMHGANLGNYLEIPAGQNWGVRITTNDLDHIKSEGFDHIRVPIAWQNYAGPAPEFQIAAEMFRKVDFIVSNAV